MDMSREKLSDSRREMLYGELNALLSAGIDFSNAFVLLIDSEQNGVVKSQLENLYRRIVEGSSLKQAMYVVGSFPALDCSVVDIGERTGRLSEALAFLSEYYHKRIAQRRMVSSAVSYPIVVVCMATAVMAFMMTVVVPMFEQVYMRMGGDLPGLTRRMIAFAEVFPRYLLVGIATAVCLVVLYGHNRDNDRFQNRVGRLLLRIPLIGGMIKKSNTARICKLLDLLCTSGIPLLTGVEMVSGAMKNCPYRLSLRQIAAMLEQGHSFFEALSHYPDLYDRRFTSLIRVGEQTNRLREMLRRQGDSLTDELEHGIRRLGTILEPILILLVGVLVAVVLVSMYLPMCRLGGIMG